MSMVAVREIEHRANLVVPNLFGDLLGRDRPELLEVSCDSESLLCDMFNMRTKPSEVAIRSALWNGHDLSKPEGLRLVLEQIHSLKPKHVWVALPNQAFSALQHLNQRTPAQVQDLKAKRALAIQVYENTLELVKTCLQMGVQISVELSERSEAWRLPVLQKLRFEMGLSSCVVKGCAVGLKGANGKLMQKGWRILSIHNSLTTKLHKPCRCHTKYEHAKCEGPNARGNSRYTPEMTRLIHEALKQEGSFQEVVEECSGRSLMCDHFGLGLRCTCAEGTKKIQCGACVLQDREDERDPEAQSSLLSQAQTQELEQEARKLRQPRAEANLQKLQALLQQFPLSNTGGSRRNQHPNDYQVFGAYAYGNHYGNTNRTHEMPELCKLVNKILKQHFPKLSWTSFALNHGSLMPTHRDLHNLATYPNESIEFGDFQGGGLWVESSGVQNGREGKTSERVNSQGQVIQGLEIDIQNKGLIFSPHAWHGSCPWQGDRWVLTVFVSRGLTHLSVGDLAELEGLGFPIPQPRPEGDHQAFAVESSRHTLRDRRKEDERIRKQLYLLHCATGHSHPRHMIQALKKRGADARTIELAESFQCPVCSEQRRPPPRNLAALEPLPPKLYTIEADIGHWVHPHSEDNVNFMIIVDEGSRFRTARILTSGSKKTPNAQDCLHYLQEGWAQYFGHPRCLRLDPAGAFRSAAVEEWCDRHSIFLDIIPGEAHWKVGLVENAVKGVKEVMTKLCRYDPDLSSAEALAEAISTFNHKEIVRGYSPAQHILGQAPDETGRFVPASPEVHPGLLVENPTRELERSVKLRAEAEKALSDWCAGQRLMRAKHSRHRPSYNYIPGELVYYWRTQDANKGRRQPGGKHGRFLGPARILATETRKGPDGSAQPGGAVWLVKGRSLLKCAPEQLRRATEREELLEALSDPADQQLTWTYHAVAKEIGGNRFEDLTHDLPDDTEWHRAQDPQQEEQPRRYRMRTKRPPGAIIPGTTMEEDSEELIPDAGPRERSRSRGRGSADAAPSQDLPAAWWSSVAERHWPDQKSGYWDDQTAAIAVEIALPETQRGRDKALRDLGAYFIGSMKRRAVELTEKKMTPEEKEAFRGAKATEVRNFVASKAFEILPEHLRPDKSQAIGMRWILTWKLKEDGSRKAKARAVLLGYQDEAYEHRATTSPVMTRQTRQLVLQLSAWKRWKVQKGDVTGAFLQSRQYPDKLYCIPCPEICEALGIPPGSVTKVQKACYGLVDAPLEWYRSVDTFLREQGFTKLWSDPCCWVLREQGQLRGAISGHVDDFLFSGKEGDTLWESKLAAIKAKFKWGDWEEKKFTQCGVVVEQTNEGFELSQPTYLENLHEINICASRKKDRSQATSDKEKSQLRALLGGISWHAQQVAPYLAADVSLLLTEVSRSTIETIVKANILLNTAKSRQKQKMKIHAFHEEDDLTMVMWVDAANANRADGGSTQGLFLGMTTTAMLRGEVTPVSPISWHSQKIDRMCRSPGAAEAQAAVNGEDGLYSGRHQWSELLFGAGDLHSPDELVKQTGGVVVTDSRNVYDRLVTEVMVIKGAEKRTSIELLAIKQSQLYTNVELRWVHSEAQLANSLTKQGGQREYDLFHKMNHQWRLVEDPSMMSAKRRKEMGLAPLEHKDSPTGFRVFDNVNSAE